MERVALDVRRERDLASCYVKSKSLRGRSETDLLTQLLANCQREVGKWNCDPGKFSSKVARQLLSDDERDEAVEQNVRDVPSQGPGLNKSSAFLWYMLASN